MTSERSPSTERGARLALVLPCYNEAASLEYAVPALTQAFQAVGKPVELVLVDNGSRDGTGACIDRMCEAGYPVRKVVVEINRGKAHGVLTGLATCRTEWVGFLDADCPVSPADVAHIYQLAAASAEPVLVTVRRRFRLDGLRRQFFSVMLNLLANVLFPGLGTRDINANPKMWPRELLDIKQLSSEGWNLDLELVLKSKQRGIPIVEVNAISQPRPAGKSHVVPWRAAISQFGALLKYRLSG
jgi:glycosyltransferase involved in cell wall biosynthesis